MRWPFRNLRLRPRISKIGFWIEVGEPSQGRTPWGLPFNMLLGPLVTFLVSSGAFYGLLSESGLLRRFTDVDLTFLLYPLLTFNGVMLLGSILRRFIPA